MLSEVPHELSIRCALHKRERVPAGKSFSGFPLTTTYKPGLKTHPHPPTPPSAVLQRRPRISIKLLPSCILPSHSLYLNHYGNSLMLCTRGLSFVRRIKPRKARFANFSLPLTNKKPISTAKVNMSFLCPIFKSHSYIKSFSYISIF